MINSEKAKALSDIVSRARNGCDGHIRHALNRGFVYTSGVDELAKAGECHWLIDLLAFEPAKIFATEWDFGRCGHGMIHVGVRNGFARIELTLEDGAPPAWRYTTHTTLPDGSWEFMLARDGLLDPGRNVTVLLLPAEY